MIQAASLRVAPAAALPPLGFVAQALPVQVSKERRRIYELASAERGSGDDVHALA